MEKSLPIVLDLARRRRDEAAQRLALAQAEQRGAEQQMEQLKAYVVEKDAQWLSRANQGGGPELLYHHQQFANKLVEAIDYQGRVLISHETRIATARTELIHMEQRLNALTKLQEQMAAKARVQAYRREQKMQDDMTSGRRRSSSTNTSFTGGLHGH